MHARHRPDWRQQNAAKLLWLDIKGAGEMRIAKTWDEVNPVLYDGDEAISTRVLEKQYRDALNRIDNLICERDRLLVLSTKWCDRNHHDWKEIIYIADKVNAE